MMIKMNRWNEYPKKKPRKSGLYLVAIKVEKSQLPKILFYESEQDKWINTERLNVFQKYEVYLPEPGPDECEVLCRKMKDNLCDVTDVVIKWKELPKC